MENQTETKNIKRRGRPPKNKLNNEVNFIQNPIEIQSADEIEFKSKTVEETEKKTYIPVLIENYGQTEINQSIIDMAAEKENDTNTVEETEKKEFKPLELIDSLDFKNGDNVLSIRFSKKHNRMFRIQVFLNDQNEIRPVTYTGSSTGHSFWNMLKGILKK